MRFFDSHIHIKSPDIEGIHALLKHMDINKNMLGGILILNTFKEVEIVSMNIDLIPTNLIIVPYFNVQYGFPDRIYTSKWVKIHPKISKITISDIPEVINFFKNMKNKLKGIIVDCFPWGTNIQYNISLYLIIQLAAEFSEINIVVAHGGGYESWLFRAHLGGLKNVFFDFSASMKYYCDTDYIKPLMKYLQHSPQQLLFGTDWPIGEVEQHVKEYKRIANEAGIDSKRLENILLNNSNSLWKLKEMKI